MNNFPEKVSLIWSVADLLRGDYKPSEYGRVILPFILLRRLDQVLALNPLRSTDSMPKLSRALQSASMKTPVSAAPRIVWPRAWAGWL